MDGRSGAGIDPGYGVAPPGHRLPAATRLGAVRLQVSDLDRSIAFYGEVLGFDVDREGSVARLRARGGAGVLIELHEHPGAAPAPRRGRLGLFHFAILLPDRPALGRILAHLGEIGVPIGASDHLVSEALYLSDPDGLGIEIYADRPRDAWRKVDRQLVMSTEPLDAPAVLGAAGGEGWSGMPAGTVIGHVHLHVGDLAAAESFYHAALGFDRVVWSYPGALFLSAGGYHHHLGLNTWAAQAAPAGSDDARLLEWEVVVPTADDVEAARSALADAGFDVEGDGPLVAADPWGTAVRVRADG